MYLEKDALCLCRIVSIIYFRYRFRYIENYVAVIKVKGMMTNWDIAQQKDLIESGHGDDWLL